MSSLLWILIAPLVLGGLPLLMGWLEELIIEPRDNLTEPNPAASRVRAPTEPREPLSAAAA